jgi:hypothetical protein
MSTDVSLSNAVKPMDQNDEKVLEKELNAGKMKEYLAEVKSLSKPPDGVKRIIEAVLLLAGFKGKDSWKEIQKVLGDRNSNIAQKLEQHSGEAPTPIPKEKALEEYLSTHKEDFVHTEVRKISKPAGFRCRVVVSLYFKHIAKPQPAAALAKLELLDLSGNGEGCLVDGKALGSLRHELVKQLVLR